MIFIAIIIGSILGAIIGFYAPIIPYTYSKYLAIGIIAGLDTVFGGINSIMKKNFDIDKWYRKEAKRNPAPSVRGTKTTTTTTKTTTTRSNSKPVNVRGTTTTTTTTRTTTTTTRTRTQSAGSGRRKH